MAGFYRPPIKLSLEESIAEINIEDEDTTITGRIDILAVNKEQKIIANVFFGLAIESKNSNANALVGLPQLLTDAYNSFKHKNRYGS